MGSSKTADRDARHGEGHGLARLTWRALLISAFAAIALLATDAPASADDCATEGVECVEASPIEHEANSADGQDDESDAPPAQDPSPDAADPDQVHRDQAPIEDNQSTDQPDPLTLVENTILPTVERILRIPDELTARTLLKAKTSENNDHARPVIDKTGTPSPETSAATAVPAKQLAPGPLVDDAIASTTVDLVAGLAHDIAQAPIGVATRVDDTTKLIDNRPSPSSSQNVSTTVKTNGLSAVTSALTSLLSVLDVSGIVDPIVAALDDTLARPLSPVAPVLDAVLVPVLRPAVERTGTALNPDGHDQNDPSQTPADADSPVVTATVPTTTSAPVAGVTTRFVGMRLRTGSVGTTSQSWQPGADPLADTAQAAGDMPVPISDATAPVPGANGDDGSGVQGVGGASGSSSADLGKVLIGALKLPGNSRSVGVQTDSWRLPESLGSEPGHSPA